MPLDSPQTAKEPMRGHMAYIGAKPCFHREDRTMQATIERLRHDLYVNCERAPEWGVQHLNLGREGAA